MATATNTGKNEKIKFNKMRKQEKYAKKLAKRKAWRLKKYGASPLESLFRGTLNLFRTWGHRSTECTTVLKTKKYSLPPRKANGKFRKA